MLVLAVSGVLITPGIAADPSTLAETVTHVRDGDTIEVGEVPIRLNGVSAPELDEQLGKRSKLFMRELVLGQLVRCELNGVAGGHG